MKLLRQLNVKNDGQKRTRCFINGWKVEVWKNEGIFVVEAFDRKNVFIERVTTEDPQEVNNFLESIDDIESVEIEQDYLEDYRDN